MLEKSGLNERKRLSRIIDRKNPQVGCADIAAIDQDMAAIRRPVRYLEPVFRPVDVLGRTPSIRRDDRHEVLLAPLSQPLNEDDLRSIGGPDRRDLRLDV